MATLTTSPQIIGRNESGTIKTYLYGWYSNQSGNTCTVHVRLTVISSGITYTGTNKTYSISIGGYSSGTQSWTYTPLNANQEYTVSEVTWNYSGGDAIWASGGFWSYVYGNANVDLSEATYVPTFSTPPSGLSASVAEVYTNGAKINVSVSNYGNPSSASGRYIEGAIMNQSTYGGTYHYTTASNVSSASVVVNNSSSGTASFTIQPNKQYYYGVYANNTQQSASRVVGQFVTSINSPSFSIAGRTGTSATIRYSAAADGGYYSKTVQYSIDEGQTWSTGVVIASGNATTGTFTINNLTPGVEYTVMTRTSTPKTTITGQTLVISDKTTKFYGSVEGEAKEITNLYASDNGVTKTITKLYGSADGEAKLIYKGFGRLDYGYGTVIYYTNDAYTETATVTMRSADDVAQLCSDAGSSASATIGGITIPFDKIKEVDFTDKVINIGDDFLMGADYLESVKLSKKLENIGRNFLFSCDRLTVPIVLPNNLQTIGHSFMGQTLYVSGAFSTPLVLPQSLTSINGRFLYMNKYNLIFSEVNVGNLSPDILGVNYMNQNFSTSSSTAPGYTTGVRIAGANRAAWLAALPNLDGTSNYRKLIDAGY